MRCFCKRPASIGGATLRHSGGSGRCGIPTSRTLLPILVFTGIFSPKCLTRFAAISLIFHAHPFIYVAPLACTFWHRPAFLAHALIAINGILRPYPSVADLSLTVTLILVHPLLLRRMRKGFPVVVGIALSLSLMPVMWYLWLYPGSANANFFYNQTLVYNFFASMMTLEFIASSVRREKDLKKYHRRKKEKDE